MKKLLPLAVLLVAGCHAGCNECEQPVVEAPTPGPIAYAAPAPVPCQQEVNVPITRTTTTYKVIEYRKPAVEIVRVQPAEYRTEKVVSEPVVEVINQPVQYSHNPVEYKRHVKHKKPVVVKEPVKLVEPTYKTYYTKDDYVK